MSSPEIKDINRILVIRLSSMGDILLTTPLVRQLKARFPYSEIDFVSSGHFSEIIDNNPYINNSIKYSKSGGLANTLSQNGIIKNYANGRSYDAIIDLQRNLRSAFLRRGLGKKYFLISKNRLNKLSLVHFKKPLNGETVPIPEVYRRTAGKLGVTDDMQGLELWLPEESGSRYYPPEISSRNHKNLTVAIAPGAHHATKRWLPERFALLIKKLNAYFGCHIVLLGGDKDYDLCLAIKEMSGIKVENASGALSIYQTARRLDSCSLLITNDTGVMHIAAARRVPVAAIFGSTVPAFGFGPYRIPHKIIEKDVDCRPCTHIGRNECPFGHYNCMKLIGADEVFNAAVKLIEK